MTDEQNPSGAGVYEFIRFLIRVPFSLYHRLLELLPAPPPSEKPVLYRVKVLRDDVWSDVASDKGQQDFESVGEALKLLSTSRKNFSPPSADRNDPVFRIEAIGRESRLGGGSIVVLSRPAWRGARPDRQRPDTWFSIPRNLLADARHDMRVRKNKVGVIDGECLFFAQYFDGRHWKDFQKEASPYAALKDARMLQRLARVPDWLMTPAEREECKQEGIPKDVFKLRSFRVIARNDRAEQAVLHALGKAGQEILAIRMILFYSFLSITLSVFWYNLFGTVFLYCLSAAVLILTFIVWLRLIVIKYSCDGTFSGLLSTSKSFIYVSKWYSLSWAIYYLKRYGPSELVRFQEGQLLAHWLNSLPWQNGLCEIPENASYSFDRFEISPGAGQMNFDDPEGVDHFYDRIKEQLARWLTSKFYSHSDFVMEHNEGRDFSNIRRALYYQKFKNEFS